MLQRAVIRLTRSKFQLCTRQISAGDSTNTRGLRFGLSYACDSSIEGARSETRWTDFPKSKFDQETSKCTKTSSCAKRLASDYPRFDSRIDTPYRVHPDCITFNDRPFRRIKQELALLQHAASPENACSSRGVLVLGNPGSGKTHLLMRLAQSADNGNAVVYVRRPTNEDAVAVQTWQNIVDSLSNDIGFTGQSQLDRLLARVFSHILIRELEEDCAVDKATDQKMRWIDQLTVDPLSIAQTLGSGETRRARLAYARRRILSRLVKQHREACPKIVDALVKFCLFSQDNDKRIIQTWLAGQEVDPLEGERLGIQPWTRDEDASSNRAIWQAREQRALDADSYTWNHLDIR